MEVSKFKITTEIRQILLDDAKISTMVGENIFPLVAPRNTKSDFILYQRNTFTTDSTKMGTYKQVPAVYINAISEDYDRSQELADLIYKCLEGTFSNPNMNIKLVDSSEDFEDGKYIQVLLFEIQ